MTSDGGTDALRAQLEDQEATVVAIIGCDDVSQGAYQALKRILDLCDRETWDAGGLGVILVREVRDTIAEALDEHDFGGTCE
ncbi:hypothetical protein [Kutzneria chonburiensis]|uniref:Uncharacterized protein n=1 Tax=Kutzneria chonburiensis TaxID=1483604 RepID=A0ABV6N3F1_9PSEU|nr:hypothetical protein [Kutzneria chonburiensis]